MLLPTSRTIGCGSVCIVLLANNLSALTFVLLLALQFSAMSKGARTA